MSSTPALAGRRSVLTRHYAVRYTCSTELSHTYTYTHCALLTRLHLHSLRPPHTPTRTLTAPLLTHLHLHSLRPPRTPTPTLPAPLLGWQSPHAFKIASALVGGLCVYFLLGGLITEYVQSLVK